MQQNKIYDSSLFEIYYVYHMGGIFILPKKLFFLGFFPRNDVLEAK